MNLQDIFKATDAAYAKSLATCNAAGAAGQATKPPVKGVTVFATMFYGDAGRIYSVIRYRILGQAEVMLEPQDRFNITPQAMDAAAAACGYKLEYPPLTGYTHHLVYRGVEGDQPPAGYSARQDQWAHHNARKRREEAVMEAGRRLAIPPQERIQVVNVRSMEPNAPGVVYCGREWAGWNESILANDNHAPGDDRATRIKKFKADLWRDIRMNGPMRQELTKLQRRLEQGETISLGCWCAPKACHCEVIRAALLWLMDNPQGPPAPLAQQPPSQQQRMAQHMARLSEPPEQYHTAPAAAPPATPAATTPGADSLRQQLAVLGYSEAEVGNMLRMDTIARHVAARRIPPEEWRHTVEQTELLHQPPPAPEPCRIIVAGSRSFTDYGLLTVTLDEARAKLAAKGKTLVVLCGMAAGADLLGKQWADAHQVPVEEFRADWNTQGKGAGFRRNEKMAERADGLIAFWDGASPGTRHMIETARQRGLVVRVIPFAAPPAPTPPTSSAPQGKVTAAGAPWPAAAVSACAGSAEAPTPTKAPTKAPTPPKAFAGNLAFLSNFHPCKVMLDGEEYASVEHAYQAAKTTNSAWRATIRAAKTPGQAKQLGKAAPMRQGWADMRLEVMRRLLAQKFSDPALKAKLLAVAQSGEIVEWNSWHDNFWGACQCAACAHKPHQNQLGQLLMEIAQAATRTAA